VAGLAPTFGRGAMTNNWVDIKNANVVLVMGGNPAEAHPCGFKWVVEAKAHNKAKLIVIDPRFTRTAAVADVFAQIRPGTDLAFLGGVIRHLLEKDAIQKEYVTAYTNAALFVKEGYAFQDGLFSGYDEAKHSYDRTTWSYELGEDGYAKSDPSLQHPRCVYQLMKGHYARYTPRMVADVTGVPEDTFRKICELIATTATPTRTLTSLYALGWTQHSVGSQNIRAIGMIQLLLGNVGMSGGGVNALRGHSNIQGLTDLGLLSDLLPGYLTLPRENDPDLATYLEKRTQKPLRPGQLSYWQNYPKFFVSLMKAWYGKAATRENDWAFSYLPKLDKVYDVLAVFDLMHQGKVNGYLCQGFNPLASIADKNKVLESLSKLKFLVTIDPLVTETSNFWQNHGALNPVEPTKIDTEVFRLPSTCFAEEDGSLVNSGRWLQWHWKAAEPPGEAKGDPEIVAELFTRIRALYQKEGGAFPEPILNLTWDYRKANSPTAEELAREFNGKALADVAAPKPADPKAPLLPPLAKEGEQLATFAHLQDDGTTASGNWLFCGAFTQAGNMMARRDPADPSGLGLTPGWGFSWPANRRVLYNRASCDPSGKPWDPARKLVWWNGAKWVGHDVPDFKLDSKPEDGMSPFIMNPEGLGRLFALDKMTDGPFPEHYEPFESPVPNAFHPKVGPNPAARIYKGDREHLGLPGEFPYAATTYRVVEHFHFWTKHTRIASILQPELFVELDEQLARAKGIRSGDVVEVRSKRGKITGKAVVTKRIKPLLIAGKEVHTVGIPLHWGFDGLTKPGHLTNTLTPFVGDANTQTPEFKAFLVDVAKATPGQV
jgi:formate dehydrogenase major subunit